MSNVNLDTEKPENLRTVYRELCSSYRAIDDFRTKLLGFLPLVTGTGLFFLVTDKAKIDAAQPYFGPIGIFGFVITLGLFFYEFLRNQAMAGLAFIVSNTVACLAQ